MNFTKQERKYFSFFYLCLIFSSENEEEEKKKKLSQTQTVIDIFFYAPGISEVVDLGKTVEQIHSNTLAKQKDFW